MKRAGLFLITAYGSLFIGIFFVMSFSLPESQDLDELYFNAQFSHIASQLQNREGALSFDENLLYAECLARTAQGRAAEKNIQSLLDEFPDSADVLAVAGITAFSNGRFEEARFLSEQALRAEPETHKARLTMILVALYEQDFVTARRRYEDLKNRDSKWGRSYLLYLVGLELYKASRFPDRLSILYDVQAKNLKRKDRDRSDNMKRNAKMCAKISGQRLFQVFGPDKIIIPWMENPSFENNIPLSVEVGGEVFELVLDTGNAVGWMVHDRNLYSLLDGELGGRALSQIGMVSGLLYGQNLYNERVALEDCQFLHLLGMYVPKPHPSFYDANLNQIFLRDRAVTFDFLEEQVVFRTRQTFEQELEAARTENPGRFVNLPFYGYERPLVPLDVAGKRTVLGLFETGAEDITVRLDLAQELELPLESSVRYLANGEVFRYSKAPVNIQAGRFSWSRKQAEVWPLDRFYDRLTGLIPDIVIGPQAFKGRLVLTFDPFKKQVILSDISF